jgi:peroxiredoxin
MESQPTSAGGSRRRNLAAALILALLLAAGAGAFALSRAGVEGDSPKVPFTPAAFMLEGDSGQQLSSTALRGQPTVLAFVQAGCVTCATTLDNLATATPPGARQLAVGFPSTGGQLAQFADAIGIPNGPRYLSDPSGSAAQSLGVNAIDTVVVIDSAGRVTWRALSPPESEIAAHAAGRSA